MITASDAFSLARAAIFRIAIEPKAGRDWWWATGFFVTTEYALTAFHNLPAMVRTARRGEVQGLDSAGVAFLLDFVPMDGDEQRDLALLKMHGDHRPMPRLKIATLRDGLSGAERVRFWAGRSVIVCGFPLNHKGQEEEVIAGHVRGDGPLGIQDEKDEDGVISQVERLKIVPDYHAQLPGISGGPVIDLENGLVVAVEGACDGSWRLILTSELQRHAPTWPDDVRREFVTLEHSLTALGDRTNGVRSLATAGIVLALMIGTAFAWVALKPLPRSSASPARGNASAPVAGAPTAPAISVQTATQQPASTAHDVARDTGPSSLPARQVREAPQVTASRPAMRSGSEPVDKQVQESEPVEETIAAPKPTGHRVPAGATLRVAFSRFAVSVKSGETIEAKLAEPVMALDGTVVFPAAAPVDVVVGNIRLSPSKSILVELTVTRVAGVAIRTGVEVIIGVADVNASVISLETKTFKLASTVMLETKGS